VTGGRIAVIRLFARHELVLAARSRWMQTFAVVFAGLALLVAGSGYVLAGGSGVQDFARTAVSLVQLVLLLVPLTALLFGVLELTPERGAAELLYSQPVPRAAILVGKLLGLFEALVAAEAIGFGISGLVVFSQAGDAGLPAFVSVAVGAAVLTAIFLGLAALIAGGQVGRRRARALAIALVTWFAIVVLFDVAALGAASLLEGGPASRLLIVSVIVNPVDAVRTASLLVIDGTSAFGAASLAFLRFTHGSAGAVAWLVGALAIWAIVPTLLAARRLVRVDI
jgi:Cu-processing system permease protein